LKILYAGNWRVINRAIEKGSGMRKTGENNIQAEKIERNIKKQL
jgi:hypothetical protein